MGTALRLAEVENLPNFSPERFAHFLYYLISVNSLLSHVMQKLFIILRTLISYQEKGRVPQIRGSVGFIIFKTNIMLQK